MFPFGAGASGQTLMTVHPRPGGPGGITAGAGPELTEARVLAIAQGLLEPAHRDGDDHGAVLERVTRRGLTPHAAARLLLTRLGGWESRSHA